MQNGYGGSWQKDLFLLFLAIFLFFCIGLGARPYITPSEARYIEIPRQMLSTGDFLTPHINGVQYFEKPPLFYWLQTLFLSIGNNEFLGRIATTLVVTLTCLMTYATGRLLYGRTAGLLAAAALATSVMGYCLSRVAMLDAPVTLFITCTIASFIFAQVTRRKKFYYYMYIASALAVMTKGLIGIVIPALIIGSWIMLTKNWKILKEARLFSGILLFLAIAAPWHILMAMEHPEFLDFYFIHEHFTRFLSDEHKRTAPWWFFIVVTLVGAMPWILLLTPVILLDIFFLILSFASDGNFDVKSMSEYDESDGVYSNLSNRDNILFLTIWIFLPIIFFSLSHSKLIPYIFPIFPPLFILIGKQLADWWKMPVTPKKLRINAIFLFALVWIALFVGFLSVLGQELPIISLAAALPILLVTTILFTVVITNEPAKKVIVWIMVFGATIGLTANYTASYYDNRTVKPLAEILKKELQPDDVVIAYNSYWQDLPVYLDRDVVVAGWRGELDFGIKHTPNASHWMISLNNFWEWCADAKTNLYVLIKTEDYKNITENAGCRLHEVSRYGKTILLKKDFK